MSPDEAKALAEREALIRLLYDAEIDRDHASTREASFATAILAAGYRLPTASVSEGQPSALRASAPEGQRVPLHCPHCAGDPEVVETAIDDVWWVRCTNRDCIRHRVQPYGREAAIAAWNCRAPVNHAASVEAGQPSAASAASAPEGIDAAAVAAAMWLHHPRRDNEGGWTTIEFWSEDELRQRLSFALDEVRRATPPTVQSVPPTPEGQDAFTLSYRKLESQRDRAYAERDAAIDRADANEKERDALREDADVMAVTRANNRAIMWHELAQKAVAERDRLRESWIAARHVVFAARAVVAEFAKPLDIEGSYVRRTKTLDVLRDVVTTYDQRNHEVAT